jgi:hypothetical protein
VSLQIAQTCTADGVWGLEESCASGSCVRGSCPMSCGDGCTPGEVVCSGNAVQRCEDTGDGCGIWRQPEDCEPGLSCRTGRCECLTNCMVGQRLCVGEEAVRICGESGCWSPVQPCPMTETCSNGICGSQPGMCQDACQANQVVCVNESEFQPCEQQPNGCMDFSSASACPEGMLCNSNQGCQSAACTDEACTIGQTRCNGNSIQVCEPDAVGCAVWGTRIGCGSEEICENGRCETRCTDDCSPSERRCGANNEIQICELQGACPFWVTERTCPSNQSCLTGGTCGECMPGDTDTRVCGNCGQQQRTCNTGLWSNWSDCSSQGVCMTGSQRICGNCGIQVCSDQCAWAPCTGEGECIAGAIEECGECGQRRCGDQCQWTEPCNNGAGTRFQNCRDCGWQFCCPGGDWCGCAGHYPENCGSGTCGGNGECAL